MAALGVPFLRWFKVLDARFGGVKKDRATASEKPAKIRPSQKSRL